MLVDSADCADGVGTLTAQTNFTPSSFQTQPGAAVEQISVHRAIFKAGLHFQREICFIAAAHVFRADKAKTRSTVDASSNFGGENTVFLFNV